MGQSTNAILVFGYNLGSEEDLEDVEWAAEFKERLNAQEDQDQDDLYLNLIGWESTVGNPYAVPGDIANRHENSVNAYHRERRLALADKHWEIIDHCSCDYPMYILAVKDSAITSYRGDVTEINPAELAEKAEGYALALEVACVELDLEPEESPRWFLVSMWC